MVRGASELRRAALTGLAAVGMVLLCVCALRRPAPTVPFAGHWLGDQLTRRGIPDVEGGPLDLSFPPMDVLLPRLTVPRAPTFSTLLKRGAGLPPVPRSSVYVEREDLTAAMPIPGAPLPRPPNPHPVDLGPAQTRRYTDV